MRYPLFLFLVFLLCLIAPSHAALIVNIDSHERSAEVLATLTRQALINKGCQVDRDSVSVTSANNLQVNLSQFRIDNVSGRFTGYGVHVDETLWRGSVNLELVDLSSNQLLSSTQESVEDHQPLMINGNTDLSNLRTESKVTDELSVKLAGLVMSRLVDPLSRLGACNGMTLVSTPPPPIRDREEKVVEADLINLETTKKEALLEEGLPKHPKSQNKEAKPSSPKSGSEYRLALVIGNTQYLHIPTLRNPSNDAILISRKIKAAGFELVSGAALLDLNRTGLEKAVSDFGKMLSSHPGAVGFFYYAGHGVQVNGANFLVPTDANPSRVAEVSRQAIPVDNLLQEMEDSRSGLNIIVLDACRNNPFGGRGIRESGGGLAEIRAPKGSFIVYATQPGNVAQDGPLGSNSPFARALADTLLAPGLDLFGTFNQVGLEVTSSTAGSQQPWISSSPITGRFCFTACPP